jgi:hypothetical protein
MNAWRTLPQRLLDRRLFMSRHPHAHSDHRIHPRGTFVRRIVCVL